MSGDGSEEHLSIHLHCLHNLYMFSGKSTCNFLSGEKEACDGICRQWKTFDRETIKKLNRTIRKKRAEETKNKGKSPGNKLPEHMKLKNILVKEGEPATIWHLELAYGHVIVNRMINTRTIQETL